MRFLNRPGKLIGELYGRGPERSVNVKDPVRRSHGLLANKHDAQGGVLQDAGLHTSRDKGSCRFPLVNSAIMIVRAAGSGVESSILPLAKAAKRFCSDAKWHVCTIGQKLADPAGVEQLHRSVETGITFCS